MIKVTTLCFLIWKVPSDGLSSHKGELKTVAVRKKTVAFLLAITTAMGLLFNPSRILASERPSLQAASPVSVNDDRIASLWQVIRDIDSDAQPPGCRHRRVDTESACRWR